MPALALTALTTVGVVVGVLVVMTLRARRRDAQILGLLATFGPAGERARSDPRVLLTWYPIAEAARRAFPEGFAAIEQEHSERFPFGLRQVEAAHARWTADWLEWERDHDAEYRRKGEAIEAAIEAALDTSTAAGAQTARTRLEVLEREKLERYQRRYEEYVRISRALAALTGTSDADVSDTGTPG